MNTSLRAAVDSTSITGLDGIPRTGHADGELLRLGHALAVAAGREAKAWAIVGYGKPDEAYAVPSAMGRKTAAIVERIEALQATTIAGLDVKRRAVVWCHGGDPVTAAALADAPNPTTDMRLIAGILADLAEMGRH